MIDRKEANKAMLFSAEMRSNLQIMAKSKLVSTAQLRETEKEVQLYLARRNLIYPPTMKRTGLRAGMSFTERKQVLGVELNFTEDTPETLEFKQMMADSQRQKLKSNWIWRIGEEAEQKAVDGWFGFFVTLTVDPNKVPDSKTMWQEGGEFRRYIRRLARVSARACGQPQAIKNGASCHDFVQHVGVIEHGKSNHHHHMHLLIWMRDIPASWKVCPNKGILNPKHRVRDWCKPMATYWPNSVIGIGRPKYFRTEGDMWSKLGFVLPFDTKKGRTINVNPPKKAGLYIAKYMDKELKTWTHRVKATRNLGMTRLKNWMMRAHLRKVEALMWRPKRYNTSILAQTIHTVPNGLLRSVAKQEFFVRQWASGSVDWEKFLQQNYSAFQAMLKSVRGGQKVKRMRSKAFYEWVTEHLLEPTGYCEARMLRAFHSLGAEFPLHRYRAINHAGIT